jgi:hypothetical protein
MPILHVIMAANIHKMFFFIFYIEF